MTTQSRPPLPRAWWQVRTSLRWLAVLALAVAGLHWPEPWQSLLLLVDPVGTARRLVRTGGFAEQVQAANVLRRQGPAAREAIPDLLALSRDPASSAATVVVSIQALAAIAPTGPEVGDAAVAALRHEGSWVDSVLLLDLLPLLPANPHVEPALLALLADPDQITRVDVANRMARHGTWSATLRAGVAARLQVETDPVARRALERLLR